MKNIIDIFRLTDKKIFKNLSKEVYIRNGVGYGFISNEFLYDNVLLEIGIGRITSGYGDWGGGHDRISKCPLSICIDKNYKIHRVETESFNNKESKKIEAIAKKFLPKLKIGSTFHVRDQFLSECIDKIFTKLPCKFNIGFDVFEYPHMINHIMDNEEANHIRESNSNTTNK